ncbi:methyltransferase family protein [Pseudonocardia sediminis]|uniref:Methyltransferase family protein n=1 Tax=Pseudonocardia sediminis TaxID=1397368 RepID=A0A4Q7UQX5_PSEST|nr:methyltransferase family protein [Pseudonocardia sediminis]
MVAPAAEIDPQVAAEWIGRWDAQQEGYVADREERFAVLADVVDAAVRDVAEPVVVDLGCGPGSLAARLSARIPHARFVGVDADPLLVGLARAHYGDVATWVLADLADDAWADALPPTIHAAVSTTALHWMDADQLAALYRTLAARTAPGGVFANGDHLALADGGLTAVADEVRAGRAERARVRDREDWQAWWDGILADPRLDAVTAGRTRAASAHPEPDEQAGPEQIGQAQHHHGSNRLSVTDHADLLRAAGYAAAGPVWQSGEDHVLVGLR